MKNLMAGLPNNINFFIILKMHTKKTKRIYLAAVGIVLLMIAFFLFFRLIGARPEPEMASQSDTGAIGDIVNNIYSLDNKEVRLVDGYAAESIDEGASSEIIRYFGNAATGDLNGDGSDDQVFLLTRDGGGSGTFYYIAAALAVDGGYQGLNALFLGDRIAPQTTEIKDGRVIVNYADRAAGEPFSVSPSIGVSRYFEIINDWLTEINIVY